LAKQKKKPTKRHKSKTKIDVSNLLISALVDFTVGFLLILIDKIIG
jgi:hypothetical protein